MPFSPEDGAQLKIDIIEWHDGVEFLKKCTIVDLGVEMRDILTRGNILAEGAQGVMLDVRFGDYPYVTSSSTIAGGIFSGASIGLDQLGTIYAVIKPYPTKVGGGPFPSRILEGKIEEAFRECGGEFGASTGRPRFIGAPDFVQLRYALKLHEGYGKIQFIISKTDSFPDGVGEMPVIVKYKYKDGTASNELRFPLSDVVGVETQKCKSWKTSKGLKTYDSNQCFGLDLFINQLSNELFDIRDQYEIYMIGTGPAVGEYFFYPKV